MTLVWPTFCVDHNLDTIMIVWPTCFDPIVDNTMIVWSISVDPIADNTMTVVWPTFVLTLLSTI